MSSHVVAKLSIPVVEQFFSSVLAHMFWRPFPLSRQEDVHCREVALWCSDISSFPKGLGGWLRFRIEEQILTLFIQNRVFHLFFLTFGFIHFLELNSTGVFQYRIKLWLNNLEMKVLSAAKLFIGMCQSLLLEHMVLDMLLIEMFRLTFISMLQSKKD